LPCVDNARVAREIWRESLRSGASHDGMDSPASQRRWMI